jgi:hypothetical protein
MKRFIEGENRRQAKLLPDSLEDYVTEDNPVRAGCTAYLRSAGSMRSNQFLKVLVFLFATSLMVQSCAMTPEGPSPPNESARESLGKFGVVSTGSPLDGKVSGPIGVGNEATKGVVEDGAIGGASGAGVGALVGLLCGPFLCVPAFAGVGARGVWY